VSAAEQGYGSGAGGGPVQHTKEIDMERPLCNYAIGVMFLAVFSGQALAVHPDPEPRPGFSSQTLSNDGITTVVVSPEGLRPLGDNQLNYVESNLFDGNGDEMVNTLPSRPGNQFNLLDGPVQITSIDSTSPADDLEMVLDGVRSAAKKDIIDSSLIDFGLDILEGEPVDRAYSGMAMLHYTGPERIRRVTPIFDAAGNKIGGNVDVHQVWWDGRIESDTAMLDPTDVQDVPWTISYTVDVLNGGADDFSPYVMYFDAPPFEGSFVSDHLHGPPHVAMDATFYPMSQGERHVIKVKHAPAKYFNLVYTWGWRVHPPRVQVMENALKVAGPMTLGQWEVSTFGSAPRASESAKLAAIAKLGELSPAKRMWQALRDARTASPNEAVALMDDALSAFEDWSDRRALPRGVNADPNADITLFYVNNVIYGNKKKFDNWRGRGSVFRATLRNGDHFVHGYVNVDFGGSRGWENQFTFGSGPGGAHTFGRLHWWVTAGGPNGGIIVPPVTSDGTPGLHKVAIQLNFDPPQRLKLYQFDPFHHDVSVYSLH